MKERLIFDSDVEEWIIILEYCINLNPVNNL